jgi:hypothetical protein
MVELQTGETEAIFTAAQVATVGTGVAQVDAVQVGDFAISRPASLLLTI